jgi:hypothetical protein
MHASTVLFMDISYHYRDFLLHDPPKLLEDVPLAARARMWYMHDGAPAHFNRAVRDVLNIMTDG